MNRISDSHTMTYKIEFYFDEEEISLKDLLEEMYLAYVRNSKNSKVQKVNNVV